MASTTDSTLAPSRRAFFGSAVGAGYAATLPPIFTVAGASALALACDFAIQHSEWIKAQSETANWSGNELSIHCQTCDVIMDRAIEEPSRDMADIQAKARLCLHDLRAMGSLDNPDPNLELAAVILGEILGLSTG